MKPTILFLIFLISCQSKQEMSNTNLTHSKSTKSKNDLFTLDLKTNESFVKITPPENSDFALPDSLAQIEVSKFEDFNADSKKDVLINLGACGTGGCMAGIFLNQYDNYYKLVFMDYLKNVEYTVEKNGFWTIESSEEIEAYNPSKLHISVFKFDKNEYRYKLDTAYISIDKDAEIDK